MKEKRFHPVATASLLCAILMWCTIPLFLRSFIHEIDSWTANGCRYTFAALLWSVPLVLQLRWKLVDYRVFRLALIPTCINLFVQSLWGMVPYYLEPAMMMFLSRLSIVFAIIGSFIVFQDERPLAKSVFFWIGILTCISGFVGMNLLRDDLGNVKSLTGLCIVIGQAMAMGSYGVSIRYFMRGIPPWVSFPVISIYTSVCLIGLMFWMGEPHRLLDMQPHRWGILAVSALMGIALAHVFYYYALENIGVSISAGSSILMPFLTATLSYWIYGERFTGWQWVCGLVLLCGAGLLIREQQHVHISKQPTIATPVPELEEFSTAEESRELD